MGIISYSLTANLDRTHGKSSITSKLSIKVNGALDLNTEPGLAQPVCYEKHEEVSSFLGKSGAIGYKITLAKTGFVPGEFIRFSAHFINTWRQKSPAVKLTLVQITTFHACSFYTLPVKNKSKEESRSIGTLRFSEDEDSFHWGGEILQIPSLPPSKLAPCKIIDVQYVLKVGSKSRFFLLL